MIQDLDLVGQLASGAATQTDAQKERKKLQNRRNQQARSRFSHWRKTIKSFFPLSEVLSFSQMLTLT